MARTANALRWSGGPGHYEVYYLTLTDPGTGVGVWIRYTMLAPDPRSAESASCSLWFLAMDPRPGATPTLGRKASYPITQLHARADPFELRIGDALMREDAIEGAFEDVSWDLRWRASVRAYQPVHPILERLGVAQTVLVLPHADIALDGSVTFAGQRLELSGVRGGQAHIWGSKHARSWAWVHCNDFSTPAGEPVSGAFLDGVSATVSRLGRDVGPSTPVVARIDGQDFESISPVRILRNRSTYELTRWRFEAAAGARKLVGEVEAVRDQLAGVTYHDPDGEQAFCYNTETAALRLDVYGRARRSGWSHRQTLVAPGRAHFEYGQRTPVPGLELLIR